jgi:hypothetical protein
MLSTGVMVLLPASAAVAFLASFLNPESKSRLGWRYESSDIQTLLLGLGGVLTFLVLGFVFHLTAVTAFTWLLGGLVAIWLLGGFGFNGLQRGILLLLAAYWLFPFGSAVSQNFVPLQASLFGLLTGRWLCLRDEDSWEDFCLPAVWLLACSWIPLALPESVWTPMGNLLSGFLGVSLLARALQSLPFLPVANRPGLQTIFLTVVAGLGGWLTIQTLLMQPAWTHWAWLYAGGALLATLLAAVSRGWENTLVGRLIQLTLIGLGALVASRLFGTAGWLVLSLGLLVIPQNQSGLALAALYFLGRVLLQIFIFQYNPNVTGINITHPYASAALYTGFALMLVLSGLMNAPEGQRRNGGLNAILLMAALLSGVVAAYYLHAEGTGSFLVSLLVAGLGVGLVNVGTAGVLSVRPLVWGQLIAAATLLGHEVLELGNQAEKSTKLIVLAVAMLLLVLLVWAAQRGVSGRKPVEIAGN